MSSPIPFWKNAPAIRLLLPCIAGIILQRYLSLRLPILLDLSLLWLLPTACFPFLPLSKRLRYSWITGCSIPLLFIILGALLFQQSDIRNCPRWLGSSPSDSSNTTLFEIRESPVEKPNSFKTVASARFILQADKAVATSGNAILYFKKEALPAGLSPGSLILLQKPLQLVRNAGNPGSFDYVRYALSQQITHQLYLVAGDFELVGKMPATALQRFLDAATQHVLQAMRNYIPGQKERGLAEALLIGYKQDLDPVLVQSYTNTGVVHIIAISGLHLGLIYWLLVTMLRPLAKWTRLTFLRPLLVLTGLWLFTLLVGAQPSVLRSAVMFTCMLLADSFSRRSSVYNALALSAFLILCYNPFWLWDAGFQLSYAAVLSIVRFMRPIYTLCYFPNRLVDAIWKLNAVTIAAQILTVPLCLYHFHQFPNYFLLTNFIAVPLSSLVVLGEIAVCFLTPFPIAATITGRLTGWLIGLMNGYIGRVEHLPFSLWNGLQVSLLQTILLFFLIAALNHWLINHSTLSLKMALLALLAFLCLRSASFIQTAGQRKLIVFNLPRQRAIDLIDGHEYHFIGNPYGNDSLATAQLQSSRTGYRVHPAISARDILMKDGLICFRSLRLMLLNDHCSFHPDSNKQVVDVLLLSGGASIDLTVAIQALHIKQVVLDASVPAWKINSWEKDCMKLNIPCHVVAGGGAFIRDIN